MQSIEEFSPINDQDFLCSLTDGNVGVQIQAYDQGDHFYNNSQWRFDHGSCNDGESRRNILCNNFFYDLVDGIAFFWDKELGSQQRPRSCTGDVPQTIVDRNVLHVNKVNISNPTSQNNEIIEYSVAENGMDLKVGAFSPRDEVQITNNQMWGFRPGFPDDHPLECGADGDASAVSLHFNTQNVRFEDNFFFDCSVGIFINPSPSSASEVEENKGAVKNISVVNNFFDSIKYHPEFNATPSDVSNYGHPVIVREYGENIRITTNTFQNSKVIYFGGDCSSHDRNILLNRSNGYWIHSNKFYSSYQKGNFLYRLDLLNNDNLRVHPEVLVDRPCQDQSLCFNFDDINSFYSNPNFSTFKQKISRFPQTDKNMNNHQSGCDCLVRFSKVK